MSTQIDYERTLRETILETLVPESDDVVGFVVEDPDLQEIGWWVYISGKPSFFGKTFKAAIFTATQGDWFLSHRDGTLIPLVIEWFEERANNPAWEDVETQEQRNSRRERKTCNAELTSDDLNYEPLYNPETSSESGTTLNNDEMNEILEDFETPQLSQIREIEVLEIKGFPGYWVLDDDVEFIQKVNVIIHEDGWVLSSHEKIPAQIGMEMTTDRKSVV